MEENHNSDMAATGSGNEDDTKPIALQQLQTTSPIEDASHRSDSGEQAKAGATGNDIGHAHTNLAFEADDDEFVILDEEGDTLGELVGAKVSAVEAQQQVELDNMPNKLNLVRAKSREEDSSQRDDPAHVKVVKPTAFGKRLPHKAYSIAGPLPTTEHRIGDGACGTDQDAIDSHAQNTDNSIKQQQSEQQNQGSDARKLPTVQKKRNMLASRLKATPVDSLDGNAVKSNTLAMSFADSMRMVSASKTQSLDRPMSAGKWKGAKKKLLRDLSFSDADDADPGCIANYGHLKNAFVIPAREVLLRKQGSLEEHDDLVEEKVEDLPDDVKAPLRLLMQELINRGKIKQMAVMNKFGSRIVASTDFSLSEFGMCGLVKATLGTQQMLKLLIDGEVYSCFRHSPEKMVARGEDLVLVAQSTETTVVVAQALDDTPGSCLYEVAEFADVLTDKGW